MGNSFRKTRHNEELQNGPNQVLTEQPPAQPWPGVKNCSQNAIGFISVMSIVIALVIALAVVASKPHCSPPDLPATACLDDWIGYRGKCYLFSEAEGNWTSGQSHCSSLGASLAVPDTQKDLDFLLQHKGSRLCWIGLWREPGKPWKQADGTEFSLFKVSGDGQCAYLNERISSSRCYTDMKWICSQPDELAKRKQNGDLRA